MLASKLRLGDPCASQHVRGWRSNDTNLFVVGPQPIWTLGPLGLSAFSGFDFLDFFRKSKSCQLCIGGLAFLGQAHRTQLFSFL